MVVVLVLLLLRCEQRVVLRAVRRDAHVGPCNGTNADAPRDMTPIHQRDVLAPLTQ
jgi:hypothetical protein